MSTSRRLGQADAVVIGLASMIGAGAFVSLGAGLDLAGPAALLAVGLAALVALANALSTAQLAAQHPSSGGTYVFAGRQLGPLWGFLAGWCFVIGKVASCAAMALVLAAYLVPTPAVRIVALGVVVLLTAVNLLGITRTAALARLLVAVSITSLLATALRIGIGLAAGLGGQGLQAPAPGPTARAAGGLWDGGLLAVGHAALERGEGSVAAVGLAVLQAAAVMFFAVAGYARVATLGEEVEDPRRTIPRAIVLALGVVVGLYLVLGVLLVQLGPPDAIRLGATVDAWAADGQWGPAPFRIALGLVGAGPGWIIVITVGASAAAAGALLALIAGISRTMLAMARGGDLPRMFAHVSPRTGVPDRAQVAAGLAVLALLLAADGTVAAILASSFGVLLYYALANASALTQQGEHRRMPRAVSWGGLVGCIALVAALPGRTIVAGLVIIAVGLLARQAQRSWGSTSAR